MEVVVAAAAAVGSSMVSATTSKSPAGTSLRSGSSVERTTPTTITPSISAAPTLSEAPNRTAMTAPVAPSVATIGATMLTLPTLSAAYVIWSAIT